MSQRLDDIHAACDRVLMDTISPALKLSIDRLRARKTPDWSIMEMVRATAMKAGGTSTSTVVLAVEAYLASLSSGK